MNKDNENAGIGTKASPNNKLQVSDSFKLDDLHAGAVTEQFQRVQLGLKRVP